MGCLCPGPQPAFTEGLLGLTDGVAVSKGGSSLEVKGEERSCQRGTQGEHIPDSVASNNQSLAGRNGTCVRKGEPPVGQEL